jgi:predicted RND superfamily exporter protein
MNTIPKRLLATVVALGLALAGCGGSSDDAGGGRPEAGQRGPGSPGGEETAAVPVEVASVKRQSVASYIQTNGSLEAENDVVIVARTQGPLVELLTEEGRRVSRGQVMARIDPKETQAQVKIAQVSLRDAERIYKRAEETFAEKLGDEVPITVTGRSALGARTFSALIDSMARSYIFALVVITPLMMLLIGDVRLGLISMAPNLLPVFLILAAMGLFDLPLDASSMMVGSIVIGLAVDDTIHILHRFRMEFERSGDTHQAVQETLRTTGTALFFTTLVLTTGFTTMASLGTMENTIRFGYLSALGIAIAFVANVLLTPALVALTKRFQTPARAGS